jgi:large subunit ribosomal protein L18
MSLSKQIKARTNRRKFRIRGTQVSRGSKLRITVYRTLSNIYVQVIDDAKQITVASFSSLHLKNALGDKKTIAKNVGLELGKILNQEKIGNVFFDRGEYLYHGRVKALADGLRESGLNF